MLTFKELIRLYSKPHAKGPMRGIDVKFGLRLLAAVLRTVVFASLGQFAACGFVASAQLQKPVESLSTSAIVDKHPFSAVRFTRNIHIGKDGVTQTIEEKGRAQLARDTDGRIFMSVFDSFGDHCDLPDPGKTPRCGVWRKLLFDPSAGLMWHWSDGKNWDKAQYVKMDLQSEQIAEAERLTSVLQEPPKDNPKSGIRVQYLGEHDIEGVRAKGIRTTTIQTRGTDKPEIKIHEVWTSAPMRLVLRVVDANTEGEMTVSGLEHISLTPNAALFRPPVERILRHWKDGSIYAETDLRALTQWLVQ